MNEITWTDEAFDSIVSIFGTRTGLAYRSTQREATKLGIARAMQRTGTTDLSAYATLLKYDVDALDTLIVELTIGETYFFRESSQFEAIRRKILPEILERKGRWHRVRIWSAACASGEEPYSIAMLCAKEGLTSQCDILATDISSEALSKARQAKYRAWSLRGELGAEAKEFLHHSEGSYLVDERIRRVVRFEFLNLAMDVYPSHVTSTEGMDLILCRNVMIYLARSTIREVAERLYHSLADGGWLLIASGDPPVGDYAPFETTITEFGVFYRKPVADPNEEPELPKAIGRADTPRPEPPQNSKPNAVSPIQLNTSPSNSTSPDSAPGTDSAEAALSRGDYVRAVELSELHSLDPRACIVQVKALANLNTEEAVRKCTQFTHQHPLSAELHYLHAVLLMEMNLDVEAVQAVQRVVFLDRSLALAHFLLGSILQRRGALSGAKRAFRNVLDLAKTRPLDEIVPLSDHEIAGQLAKAAENHLRALDAATGTTS